MGRSTKLTPEVQKKIVDAISSGNYAEVAATYAGISRKTYFEWLVRGRKAKAGIYRDFRDAVMDASAQAEMSAVLYIRKAMPEDWRAAATYLERRYAKRWARRDALKLQGDKKNPLVITATTLGVADTELDEWRKVKREEIASNGQSA